MYNLGGLDGYSGYGNAGALAACFILSIIVALVVYFTFLSPKNEKKFTGFVGFLYDFLSFKKLLLEAILKIVYLVMACYVTLGGLVILFSSFGAGLGMIIIGNVGVRLGYEFLLILVVICKNTSDINRKVSGKQASDSDMFVSNVEIPQTVVEQFKQQVVDKVAPPRQEEKTCAFCGQKMNSDALFCPSCGKKVES